MDCGMANWARGEVMDRRGSSCRRRVRGCRWLLRQTGDEHQDACGARMGRLYQLAAARIGGAQRWYHTHPADLEMFLLYATASCC